MKELFLQILNMSITGSYVILAVMAVRLLLRKAPRKYSYALWAAVLFRLVCPVSIQSVVSAFNFTPVRKVASQATGELQFIPRDITTAPIPQINTGIPVVDTVVNNNLPAATPEASVNPMQVLILVGTVIWLAGIAIMAVASIVGYIRLRKSLRFAVRMEENVWQCEAVRSPFLVGLLAPKIYIPYGLDDRTKGYILAHEKYHLKRFDHIVKLFAYALLTIHWFNPLCHVAFRMMNSDMEMSCDEHVLDRNNISTTQYSLSLLTIATNRRFPAATPLAFAETGVKERMINVLKWKKPKKWVSVVSVTVCAILLISCATNPNVTGTGNDKVKSEDLLEIPGMKWGATVEEVKAALDLPAENYAYDVPYGGSGNVWLIVVKDFSLFGEDVAYGRFWFTKYPWIDDYAFKKAELYYTDETDMAAVRDTLRDLYGAENEGLGFARYRVRNGAVESYTEPGFRGMNKQGEEAVNAWWESNAKRADVLPADVQERMLKTGIVDTSGAGSGLDATDPASREILQEYLQKDPAVLMYCSNSVYAKNTILPNHTTEKAVCFDASLYVWATQYFLTPSNDPLYTVDGALLEFPGLKWGMTPDDVIDVLNLKKSQIELNEIYVPDENDAETEYDTWYLHATDIEFLDSDVLEARFVFVRYPGQDFGLLYIQLVFSADTDADALRDRMSVRYGEGTTEKTPFYNFEDGNLIEMETTSVNKYNFQEGYPYYFYSAVKGTEYLSGAAQSLYAIRYMQSPEIGYDAAMEYLEKQPLTEIWILARTEARTVGENEDSKITVTFRANQLVHLLQQFEK